MNLHIALALIGFKLHFNLKMSKLPKKVQIFRLSTPHSFGLVTGLQLIAIGQRLTDNSDDTVPDTIETQPRVTPHVLRLPS